MGETEKVVDVCLLTVGTATGLANIEHILGIIILVIQLAWLLTKLLVKIVIAIKHNENLDNLDDDVGSVISHLETIKCIKNSNEVDIENEHNGNE